MSRTPKKTEKKQKYNPQAQYEWEADQEFVITGLEVQAIQRALMALTNSAEFQRNALLYEAFITFQNFFKQAVEEELIKEKKEKDSPLRVEKPEEQTETIV